MNLNKIFAETQKEILEAKQRGSEYKARYQSELQMRKRRDKRLKEYENHIKELEYYIEQHWKAKGWTQKLEK